MLTKNIVLIGFMGCGKSKVSRVLVDRLGRERFSTDKIIEKKEGRTIATIFKEAGEPYFRKLEEEVVAEVAGKENVIIDCGGGVVLNPKNLAALQKHGCLFYLKASPESLLANIKVGKPRPLLQVADPLSKIHELLNARRSVYEQADFTIDADFKTIPQVADQIVKIVRQ